MDLPLVVRRDFNSPVYNATHTGDTACMWVDGMLERWVGGNRLPPIEASRLFGDRLDPNDWMHDMCLSEDGSRLAIWSNGESSGIVHISVLDIAQGTVLHTVSVEASGYYLGVWISARHQTLMALGAKKVMWWDLAAMTPDPIRETPCLDCSEEMWLHPAGQMLFNSAGSRGLVVHDLAARQSWALLVGLRSLKNLGFADSGRTLLLIEEGSTTIRRLDLETGDWSGEAPLQQPPPCLHTPDAAFSLDGAWLVGTEAGETVLWSTATGERHTQWPAVPVEDDERDPRYAFSKGHLLSTGLSAALHALPQPITAPVSPSCLTRQRMLLPNRPLERLLSPAVIAQVARLGGVLSGDRLGDYFDTKWPDTRYKATIDGEALWMVRLAGMGTLPEDWTAGRFKPFQIIGEMDGGNFFLVVHVGEQRAKGDPYVSQINHDFAGDIDVGPSHGRLSAFLAALRPE